ncbi:MAG: hypothetical protein V1492_05380 [Candidatus Micrarchaeota archaeon]
MQIKYDSDKVLDKSKDVAAAPERSRRWYNKLFDSPEKLMRVLEKFAIACIVTAPIIVAGCNGCGGVAAGPGEEPDAGISRDANGHEKDAGRDAGHDGGVEQDAEVSDSGDAQVPDGGPVDGGVDGGTDGSITAPCSSIENPSTIVSFGNTIGDYFNRTLKDRVPNEAGNTDAEYLLGGSDLTDTANPFSDGEGGTIGPTQSFMYKTDLGTDTINDDNAGKTYVQKSALWVGGADYFQDGSKAVVADIGFIAYSIKFSGAGDDFGIPVCTTPDGTDYSACKIEGTTDYETERHKVNINFMGEPWVIAEMQSPDGLVMTETKVQNGGYVILAKEAVSGILNAAIQGDPQHQVGESLPFDNLKFRLDDVQDSQGNLSAIISVLDANDNILKKDKVAEGETAAIPVNGKTYRLHVYKVANGYTFGAKWADLAIFSDEIKLQDGQQLDPDTERFNGWTVALGWKNKGASGFDTLADHLRTIVLYSDSIADVSSSGDAKLLKGDSVKLPLDNVGLCYGGIDAQYTNISFNLERSMGMTLFSKDPQTGEKVQCVVDAPFVRIAAAGPVGSILSTSDKADNTAYVVVKSANCEGSIGAVQPGSFFMKYSPSSTEYGVQQYNAGTTIFVKDLTSATVQMLNWDNAKKLFPSGVSPVPLLVFSVKEYAITGMNQFVFAVHSNESFNEDVSSDNGPLFKKGTVLYGSLGPVMQPGPDYITLSAEGGITERGSRLSSIDATSLSYDFAKDVSYSVMYVGVKQY